MIGNPIRLLRVAWDSTKLAVSVIAKNKEKAVVLSENQNAVAQQFRGKEANKQLKKLFEVKTLQSFQTGFCWC